MRTLRALAVLLVSLSPVATVGATLPTTALYQAQVPVDSQDLSELNTAFNQAINGVLIKLTGAVTTINTPTFQQQIGHANRYVQSYQYVPQELGDGWLLSVHFDQFALNNLIEELGLTRWSTQRPSVLTWVQISPDGMAWVINPEDRPQEASLFRAQADTLGVPVLFPIMDLDDRRALTVNTVSEVTLTEVMPILDRYGVEALLLGRVMPQTVLVNTATGAVLSNSPNTAAAPTQPPTTATLPLAQQAQIRRVDPAMTAITGEPEPTTPATHTTATKQAHYWVGDWQLFWPGQATPALQWQTPPESSLSRGFAAALAQTAQYLARYQPNNAPTTTPATTTTPPPPAQPAPTMTNAPSLDTPNSGATQQVRIIVSGINDLATYAQIKAYLGQLSIVESVELHSMSSGEVTYELTITGDENTLQTAIGNGGTLIGENILPGINLYRYQP